MTTLDHVSWTLAVKIARVAACIALIGVLLAVSLAVVATDSIVVIGALGALLIGIVAWRPEVAPVLLLATTPILVGLKRGTVIPYMRLNEVLLFAIVIAIAVHMFIGLIDSRKVTLANHGPFDLDWAIGLIVLSGSILPVVVRFGRGLPLSVDDITQAFVFAKLGLLYLVFRYTVRTAAEVKRCIIVSMIAVVPVAFLAVGQSMQVPGVVDLLRPWLDQPPEFYVGRGAGTIGNSGALADTMAIHMGIALALLFTYNDIPATKTYQRGIRAGLASIAACVYLVGTLGSGQFAGFLAALITFIVVALATGRRPMLLALPVTALVGTFALWPVISLRLQGFDNAAGIPPSWQGRIDNLTKFFIPRLKEDFNWAVGVRPDTSVDDPTRSIGETFIESGFLWLLWAGGLLLLLSFLFLMFTAYRRFRHASQSDDPWLRSGGVAGVAATTFILVLTIIDPHLTLRGSSDVYFPLLAMSLIAAPAPANALRSLQAGDFWTPVGWDRYTALGAASKRALDLAVSSVLLVLLAPLMLLIGLVVRTTSSGPALFRQHRVGFGEQQFIMLKFRTMFTDNDESAHREFVKSMLVESGADDDDGTLYKLTDDPRITPIGKFLRKSSLDELPQLINVIRGEMSLVGPRPSLEYEVQSYLPRYRLRAASAPGLTGLWQVEGRNDLHMVDALELDLRYVNTCSLKNDIIILAKTTKVVLQRSGH